MAYRLLFLIVFAIPGVFHIRAMGEVSTGNNACRSYEVQDDLVRGRAQRVQFPDGRQVTIVGQNHGERSLLPRLQYLLDGDGRHFSNQVFLAEIHKIYRDVTKPVFEMPNIQGTSTSEASRNSAAFLERLLREKPNLRLLAEECTMTICQSNAELGKDIYRLLIREFHRRNLLINDEIETVFRSSLGVISPYVAVVHPQLIQGRRIVGFEGREEIDQEARLEKMCLDLRNNLASRIQDRNGEFGQAVLGFRGQLNYLSLTGVYNVDDFATQIQETVQRISPSEHREAALNFVNTCLDWKRATRARDRRVATGLVAAGEDVILFVGTMHLKSVADAVAELCRSPAANTTATIRTQK